LRKKYIKGSAQAFYEKSGYGNGQAWKNELEVSHISATLGAANQEGNPD
jgi:hypothetical protein